MTFYIDSHTTTDVIPDMSSGVQTENRIPHDRYDIRGIAHAHTNTYLLKWRQGDLYIDKAHTVLNIFRFAVFFLDLTLKKRIDTQPKFIFIPLPPPQ